MLIDTHCHLDFPDFDPDRDAAVRRAREAGVTTIINVASSLKASREAVRLAAQYDGVYASVGIHPHDAKDFSDGVFNELKGLVARPRVVAVGEVGLDYYRNLSDPVVQRGVFEKFIALARETKLPLIVHARMADEDVLALLKLSGASGLKGVVVHCFSGDRNFLTCCLDMGFDISFTCNITYKKAGPLREVVRLVPLERMMLETDAPFLAPEGQRGKRNEPANVVALAHEVARIKAVDFGTVCHQTTQNAKRFFGIS
jgi:TatD DNase family protein